MLFLSTRSIPHQSTLDVFNSFISEKGPLPFVCQVVDLSKHPEKGQQYNIHTLPTLILGDKRYTGKLTADTLAAFLKQCSQGDTT